MVERPLELAGRQRLYDQVAAMPGVHLREIARQLGIDVRTADYHLRLLARHRLVTATEEGGFTRYFPRSSDGRGREIVDARDKPLLGLLRKRVPLYIALVLLTTDAAGHGDLARGVGVAPSTLSYHLARMEDAGMLARRGDLYILRDPGGVARLLYAHVPSPDLVDEFAALWEDFSL